MFTDLSCVCLLPQLKLVFAILKDRLHLFWMPVIAFFIIVLIISLFIVFFVFMAMLDLLFCYSVL